MERISRARNTTIRSLADAIISMPAAESSIRAGYSGPLTPSRLRNPSDRRSPRAVAARMIVRPRTENPSTATIPDRAW
jgi:hypothetical protein